MYKATVTLKFDSEWKSTSSFVYDDSMLPEEHIVMECPAHDLNAYQYFRLFRNFMLAIGMDEESVIRGACGLAFSDERPYEKMRKIADEFDLVLKEDVATKVKEGIEKEKEIDEEWARIHNQNERIDQLVAENIDLKAKLSRLQDPDNPNYTEEEIAALTYQNTKK